MPSEVPTGEQARTVSRPYRPPVRLDILLLVFIVLLGAGLRLLWIRSPLLDAHRWRQADTAAIARNLYEDRFNVFYPQVDWGGRDGYVESEFPLVPALAAGLYEVFGPQDYLGRVVAMVFSTATIVAMFFLGDRAAGRGRRTGGRVPGGRVAGRGVLRAHVHARLADAVLLGRRASSRSSATFAPAAAARCGWAAPRSGSPA